MTRLIAVANQKGGVGKTTCAVNLACLWARQAGSGRVLLIDIDPQANSTHVLCGITMAAGPRRVGVHTIKEVLLEQVKPQEALQVIQLSKTQNKDGRFFPASTLHILPSHLELVTTESLLTTTFRGEYRLKEAMADLVSQYDMIMVDCPPSLGSLTLNALIFCEEVLIPVNPGEFSLVGLGLLQSTIGQARKANPRLHIGAVLPNAMDRTRLANETLVEVQAHFGDLVLPPIPNRVAIGEAHSNGTDIFGYAPDSDGAVAYLAALQELMKHG